MQKLHLQCCLTLFVSWPQLDRYMERGNIGYPAQYWYWIKIRNYIMARYWYRVPSSFGHPQHQLLITLTCLQTHLFCHPIYSILRTHVLLSWLCPGIPAAFWIMSRRYRGYKCMGHACGLTYNQALGTCFSHLLQCFSFIGILGSHNTFCPLFHLLWPLWI